MNYKYYRLIGILALVIGVACLAFLGVKSVKDASASLGDMAAPDALIFENTVEETVKETMAETEEETTVETTVEETIAETEPVVPAVRYFDVPLSEELQDHIFAVCEQYGVDPLMVIAMAKKETEFQYWLIGDSGNAYGLLQIWPYWHGDRMARLGCYDLLDPFQNVTVGVDAIAEIQSMGGSLEWVLMSYNGGYGHANDHIAAGTISDYAATVKYYMSIIERK